MRERWAGEVIRRAAVFWSDDRRRHLLGNRRLLLDPVRDAPMLRVMTLVQRDGSMNQKAIRKLLQINQIVVLLEPVLLDLMRAHPVVRVLDAACGRSYLGLLLAWCFRELWKHPAQVLGIDRQELLINKCRRRSPIAGSLRYIAAPLAALDLAGAWQQTFAPVPTEQPVHVVLSLHACDTATDDVLALAVRAKAPLVAVVPCCQAELASFWAGAAAACGDHPLSPIWHSPQLRREMGATMTDALRMLILRTRGYRVTAIEGVPSEHTPKSTLLRAVLEPSPEDIRAAEKQYRALRAVCGEPTLALARALSE